MSDRVYITRARAESLETSQPVKYDRVILKKNDETAFYAPPGLTDAQWNAMTGKICEKDNPYATQEMANQILAALIAFDYMPFDARIRNDMSAQIGDPILIDGNYSIIASHDLEATALSMASVSAKGKEEEDELGYISAEARAFNRKLSQAATEFRVGLNGITSRVQNVESEYTEISQTVEGLEITISSEDGTSVFKLGSNGATISTQTIDLTVDAVNISGTLTASQIATNIAQVNNILCLGDNSSAQSQLVLSQNAYIMRNTVGDLSILVSNGDIDFTSIGGSINLSADEIFLGNKTRFSTASYGTTLPASGSPGEIFFLI